ncbi:MAG: Ferric enterobactin transport ATP-binding protein FepC [Chlamydiae bacterium]|nr:Ferric enterobactin transport ATP-binding protein FepC [Chlamydiota bacterium]
MAIEVDQLTVNYEKTSALWDLRFSVPQGRLVGVIGPNGAGKSTLFKALLGIVKPLSGKILFFGKPLSEMKHRVAYVPQKGSIDWDFPITVFDVVLMGRYRFLKGLKWYRKADKEAAARILRRLGMSELAGRQISELSGGQQQRLFIARALMQEAELYLLDEPFAGVDKASEGVIMAILRALKEEGKTILVVHHELSSAAEYFDSALLLNTSLIAHGDIADVLTPELLSRTYGQKGVLFDEAWRLSKEKATGLN